MKEQNVYVRANLGSCGLFIHLLGSLRLQIDPEFLSMFLSLIWREGERHNQNETSSLYLSFTPSSQKATHTHLIMGKALRLEEQHSLAHMAVAVSEETVWELLLTLGSYVAKYNNTVMSNSKS